MPSLLVQKNILLQYTSCQQLIQIKPAFYGGDVIVQDSLSSMMEILLYNSAVMTQKL